MTTTARKRTRPGPSSRAAAAGFTLVELIVATSIFVVVLGAAYALFDSGRNLSLRAEGHAHLYQAARAALKAIEEDLKGAVMPSKGYDTGFIGTDTGSPDQPLDTIQFFAVNNVTMPRSLKVDAAHQALTRPRIDISSVSYWVETDPKKPAHGLVRWRQSILTPVTPPSPRDEDIEEVAPEVVFLNLRYYDTTNGWQDSWDSTQLNKLPMAVEVTLHLQGDWRKEPYIEKFTSRFFLPVGAVTPARKTP